MVRGLIGTSWATQPKEFISSVVVVAVDKLLTLTLIRSLCQDFYNPNSSAVEECNLLGMYVRARMLVFNYHTCILCDISGSF